MDRINTYQNILIDILTYFGNIKYRYMPEVKKQKVIDLANNHYLLLAMGNYKGNFIYQTTFHFDIIDEKIWVQCNNADVEILEELTDRGVAYEDIVLSGKAK